jgi:hypothetical protein
MRAIFFTALGSIILAIVEAGLHWYGRCLTGYLRKTGGLARMIASNWEICPRSAIALSSIALFSNSFNKAQYSIHEFLSPNVVFM